MIIKTAMSLACAAACLVTVATTPAAEAARQSIVVKHPPIVSPGDVTESWDGAAERDREQAIRAAAEDKSRFPPGADAKGVRPDHRSRTT
jgi:hypothetical protein